MLENLLWTVTQSADQVLHRLPPSELTAPIWSWAAVPGPINIDRGLEKATFDVALHSCTVDVVDSRGPFGSIRGGSLTLAAHARPAQWVHKRIYSDTDVFGFSISQCYTHSILSIKPKM